MKPSCTPPETVFPDTLNTPAFRFAWDAWLAERRARFPREKLTPRILASQLARCASAPGGHDHAVAMLEMAADRGWKAVFADWVPAPRAKPSEPPPPAPKEAWQIEKEIASLKAQRAQFWRTDFESDSGRARYPDQWRKFLAATERIRALEKTLPS